MTGFRYVVAVPHDQTLTSEFYINTIPSFDAALRVRRPKLGLCGTKLHWDNARPHTAEATKADLSRRGVKMLPQPPYSQDLAPTDFFGYLKNRIKGTRFTTSDEIVSGLELIMDELGNEDLLRSSKTRKFVSIVLLTTMESIITHKTKTNSTIFFHLK